MVGDREGLDGDLFFIFFIPGRKDMLPRPGDSNYKKENEEDVFTLRAWIGGLSLFHGSGSQGMVNPTTTIKTNRSMDDGLSLLLTVYPSRGNRL